MKNKSLPVKLRSGEITWGSRYLLFELAFLGNLLGLFVPMVWRSVTGTELTAIYCFINLAAVLWIFRKFLLSSLRYSLSNWLPTVLTALIALAIYLLVFRLLNHILPEFQNPNDSQIRTNLKANPWLTAAVAIFLVPLAEETLFRGLIFGFLHNKNRFIAYSVSTVAFCLIHISGYIQTSPPTFLLLSFIQYIPAGLTLAWAYEHSGSIYAPVLMHTMINTIGTIDLR